ncbi:MAG: transglycosylase SLT domain-containing protein [Bdellovibrionota bacterium]|nr:transglycosylase SLT domain-containing protein [Bdellovibrionota bacterium]
MSSQKNDVQESIIDNNFPLSENFWGPTFTLKGGDHLGLQNNVFDFPVVYNKKVEIWVNYFLTRGRGFFERYSQRAGQFGPLIIEIIKSFGLPKDLIFLAMAESGFRNTAKSRAKAVGIWQFMPHTAKRFGLKIDWFIDERRDPIKATIAACRYLTYLYKRFGSWELAAAAYNAGEGKVSRALRRYKTKNFWTIAKGRYLKRETKNYVPKIMALAIVGKNLKSFGFKRMDFLSPFDFKEVNVLPNTDLFLLARELDLPFKVLKEYNPELLRWQTPLSEKMYPLRLPLGKKKLWEDCCSGRELLATSYQVYKVRRKNSTLRDVARVFRLDPKLLKLLNGYGVYRKLNVGGQVILPFRIGQSRKDRMYGDLYERRRRRKVRSRGLRRRINIAKRRGKKIKNPSRFYRVRKGDNLWDISNRTGTSLDTLILSNLSIIKNRKIREGDRLIIR